MLIEPKITLIPWLIMIVAVDSLVCMSVVSSSFVLNHKKSSKYQG